MNFISLETNSFITLDNQKNLIEEVILYPLKVNRDKRGVLVETLKATWAEVYSNKRPFAQNYYSITEPGIARDKDLWHVHKLQEDRFVVISGDIVVALFDYRKTKKTYKMLNLFKMGEANGDSGQYLLLIPMGVMHGFCVVSEKPAVLLNFPTRLYDPNDEGRIPHLEANAIFSDGASFSWEKIISSFR